MAVTQAWHALSADAVLSHVGSVRAGLSETEAATRLARHGPNRLPSPPPRSALRRLLRQFHNVLIYVLLVAAVVVLLLGHVLDAAVIVGVTVVNAIIGFVQEGRAEDALAAIRGMLAPTAVVVRAGRRRTVPAADLVPGDVVHVESGDRVAADLRLLESHGTAIDESALTGESAPVDKGVVPVPEVTPIAERADIAWAGTLVTHGQATGVVVATGSNTEIGAVSRLVAGVETLETPLSIKLARFGRHLTIAVVLAAVGVFAVGIARGRDMADTFLAVVGIAVAAIPEGLPAIVTIALAIGVGRMARRNAIVRRLPSVETLGAVTVICTDKTGTLTRNEMTVRRAVTFEGEYDVTGTGYAPEGEVHHKGSRVDVFQHSALAALVRAAILCNDAAVLRTGAGWRMEGDPTEGALVTLALKSGLDVEAERARAERVDAVPFEADRRWMATVHRQPGADTMIVVKGAPETVLAMCPLQLTAAGELPLEHGYWNMVLDGLTDSGMRVLAVAARFVEEGDAAFLSPSIPLPEGEGGTPPSPTGRRTGDEGSPLHGASLSNLTLLGLIGSIDPPRDEAVAAIARCHAAGIRVKMITGDHALTARAVARDLGLDGDRVLTGTDLDRIEPDKLIHAIEDADVFARTSPEHKLMLVSALQHDGDVVAMTGDGVNDAPALKRADVGVAMGHKGTEAAKEAAAIVLADDNFASIAHAVEEGRAVYENIRKAILYILPTSSAQAGVLVIAIMAGWTAPVTAVQILWVNMVTATLLSLVIAFEPVEGHIMLRPPRSREEPLLSRLLIWRTILVTGLLAGGVLLLHYMELERGLSEAAARTAAVNALVMGEIFYLFNMRRTGRSVLNRELLVGNRYALPGVVLLLLLQIGFTYLPPMQRLFGTGGLDAFAWLSCLLVGALVFVMVELEKFAVMRWNPGSS